MIWIKVGIYFLIAAVVIAFMFISKMVVVIRGSEIGILERKYFGKQLPPDRVIATGRQIGVLAKTLGPGLHILIPFLYAVNKVGFINIGPDQIGLVESIDGAPLEPGRIFGRSVAGHNHFQDAEAFLNNGGQKGPQVDIIPPGTYRINPRLFHITIAEATTIDNNAIGIIEAIDGAPLAPGQIFGRSVTGHNNYQQAEEFYSNGGQKGPQLDILPPGTYRINTLMFKVRLAEATVIDKGFVGVVNANDGQTIDPGRLLAKSIDGHNKFQDGDAFLRNGGQKGPQIDVLLAGTYRINTLVFNVNVVPAIEITAGKIGLVTAKDGEPLPDNELVAQPVTGHDSYQNAAAFLKNQGQRGPQHDVLPPGTYYINPLMFTVDLDDATKVEQGQVAVIISNVGKQPENSVAIGTLPTSEQRTEQYVVPRGYRGIQKEVMGPGTYYINRRAYIPVLVETTNVTIDWDDQSNTPFDQLRVISKDGFEIRVGVKVVLRVQPEQAPYMLARIGGVQNLIANVIHPLIDSSFRNQASSAQAMQFMQDRHLQQEQAFDRAAEELKKYHVEVLSVLICQISLPEQLMETLTNKVIADQRQSMYEQQQSAEAKRIAMERTKAEADKQAVLVAAEVDAKVAEQQRLRTVTIARGDSEKITLEGQGEANKVLAIGQATAQAYQQISAAVGPTGLVNIELMKLIAGGNIKITPDMLVTGNDGGLLLNALMSNMLKPQA